MQRGSTGQIEQGTEGDKPCTVMTKITRESTRQNASARKHATKKYKEERFYGFTDVIPIACCFPSLYRLCLGNKAEFFQRKASLRTSVEIYFKSTIN